MTRKERRRRRRNSLKSQQQQQQQVSLSQIKSATEFYLPDECWESVFKFFITKGDNWTDSRYFKSLSVVSKQFLSITNCLQSSLTICKQTHPFLPRLFHRFTNLTSLNLEYYYGNLNKLLEEISHFPLNLTSLVLFHKPIIPADGLRAFSQKITTLTSLTCLYIESFQSSDLFLIADCFPNLQRLDLSYCRDISEEGISNVLRRCCNIRHLNLVCCSSVKLCAMNFEVPKSCRGLLRLLLSCCNDVTEKGVKHVVENCTQLKEINLRGCHRNGVSSLISSRPSLRKIVVF